MEKKTTAKFGQSGSMEYILRSQIAKSQDGLVKLSPGTAKRILDELNFPKQRNISESRVYGHAHKIRSGDWIENYPVYFAALPDGRIWLVDGQNRLTAISQFDSAVPVTLRIAEFDSEKEVGEFYAGFDCKSSVRTNEQIISAVGIAQEAGITDRMARSVFEAAPLLLNNLEPLVGSANVHANPGLFLQDNRMRVISEWAKEAKEFESLVKMASKGLLQKMRSTGPVSVALYTLRHQPTKAREFWQGLAMNDGLRRADPRATLINDFLTRSGAKGSVRQRVQQSALAWNAFCEGRDLKIIKCIDGAQITLWGTPLNGKAAK